MHTNAILAAQGLRNATVVDRDDTREDGTAHPAASGLVETTNSSRRRRDGLRQRGLRRPADSATERTPTAVRYIDGLRNGWRAANALHDTVVSDRPVPSTDSGRRHTAANGLRQTTQSSRRQRDGLRQRDYLGFIGSSGVNLWEVYAALAWVSDASVLFPVLL